MKAIRIHAYGGPEVLAYEDAPLPEPGTDEARVKLAAIGINFIDVYHRTGLYPSAFPFTPGMEGAGTIDALGPGETKFRTGDRVAYAMVKGAYADYAVVPFDKLVALPHNVDFRLGAAVMLQGMTAHYLAYSTYPIQKGDAVLLHAAGGGVGLLLTQVAKRLGATVYGTASTEEKSRLAKEAGADEVILYSEVDFEQEVQRLTAGQGVHVVYDSVGQATFERSLRCLKPRGYLVLFGQSSGMVAPISPSILAKGSLYLSRPMLGDYIQDASELEWRARDVFTWLADGSLTVQIGGEYPLSQAAEAHRQLESRIRIGKLLLIP